ncbi:MAG TPA: universal stress protein [Bryobacteraceae bacterium]|nr:universal stress protein [Bryobacteraceae bacterium]
MRILIAVGRNSECADPVAAAASLTWPADAVFSVLTVSEFVRVPAMAELVPGAADVPDVQSRADAAAGEIATTAAAQLRDHGFQADGIAKQGDPKSVIVDHASEWGADLIVVGSCEKSRIEKFVLGSVSESVVKRARCSVLVVKPRDQR